MTRQEFIADWRHEIDGWVLDAAISNRSGAELSIWLKVIRAKIETKLGAMYDAFQPPVAKEPPKPAANGNHKEKPAFVAGKIG